MSARILKQFTLILLGFTVPIFSLAAETASVLNPVGMVKELYCPTTYCDLMSMVLLVIRYYLAIIPISAVLFIIVGAIKLVTSGGNEEAIKQGKKMIFWSILGLVFAFLSFSMIAIVQNFLGASFNPQ